jgi:signal peptidase II
MKRHHLPYFGLLAGLVALDQLTKAVVVKLVPFYGNVSVVPGFFSISHIHNRGAIFGTFSQSPSPIVTIALAAASLFALVMVVVYFFRTPASQKGMKLALTLILAGALGNFIDRVLRGFVVDFLEFHVKRAYFPTFNVADSCITLGALVLILILVVRRP